MRCKREFEFQDSLHSSILGSDRKVGSALPPNIRFQVSKTSFSLEGSALSAFIFSSRFHVSKELQDSRVLLRVSCMKSTLFSASRTVCRDSILHEVDSSGRNREFARLERTTKEHLIASHSRFSILESTLLSAVRPVCKKSVLHKSESCGRF